MVFKISVRSLMIIAVIGVTVAMTMALVGVPQTYGTLATPRPDRDLILTTNNSNTTGASGENSDLIVVSPPQTENTIDCSLPSSLLNGGGDCIGTDKNDKMLSGNHGRVIGHLGDDYLVGGNISDFLFGDVGKDFVNGGTGNDWIAGQNDEDKLFGGRGNDMIWGGQKQQYPLRNETEWPSSMDYIDCGAGYDTIYIDDSDVHINCEAVNPIDPTQFLDPSLSGANLTRDNP